MPDRSGDWFAQAERDLQAARAQLDAGFPEWACFIAQQAAGKALKAVLLSWGAESRGHSVTQLLRAVAERAPVTDELRDAGRVLDRYYIPARYPNGYAEGKPGDYIVTEDATNATSGSEKIVRFSHGLLA